MNSRPNSEILQRVQPPLRSIHLSGKVWKQALPVVDPRAPATECSQKRLLLPQGELAQIYDGSDPMHYLAFIELQAGSLRGNHFHKVKEEFIYLLRGEALLLVEDTESKARATVPVQAGDLAFVATGVAHALKTVQPGQAIEFSPARFNAADIHRYPLNWADTAG